MRARPGRPEQRLQETRASPRIQKAARKTRVLSSEHKRRRAGVGVEVSPGSSSLLFPTLPTPGDNTSSTAKPKKSTRKRGGPIVATRPKKSESLVVTDDVDDEHLLEATSEGFNGIAEDALQEILQREPSLDSALSSLKLLSTPNTMRLVGRVDPDILPNALSDENTNAPRRAPSFGHLALDESQTLDIHSSDEETLAQPQLRPFKGASTTTSGRPRRSCGRVSYVQVFADDDGICDPDIDSDSDAYVAPELGSASAVENEPELSSPADCSADEGSGMDVDDADGNELDVPKKSRRKAQSASNVPQRKGKLTWDFSEPPLNNIEDIFADLAGKATQLGLLSALKKLKSRPINVATMCSGTESPIIALDMLSAALATE